MTEKNPVTGADVAPQEPLPKLCLANLANGGAEELFKEFLDEVLANIARPDTDATTKRAIMLKIEFTPNMDRNLTDVEVSAVAKLAPLTSAHGRVALGFVMGEHVAAPLRETMPLFEQPAQTAPTVLPKTGTEQK